MSERDKLILDGLTVAPNVIDTIVRLATEQVEGVAGVGAAVSLRKGAARAVDIKVNEAGRLVLDVHIQVLYGAKLHEVAATVQHAIHDALSVQVGTTPEEINVFIDGLVFVE